MKPRKAMSLDPLGRDGFDCTFYLNVQIPAGGAQTLTVYLPRGVVSRVELFHAGPDASQGPMRAPECYGVTITAWRFGLKIPARQLPAPLWSLLRWQPFHGPFLEEIKEEGPMSLTLENAAPVEFACVMRLEVSRLLAEEWSALRKRILDKPYSIARSVSRARRYLARHDRPRRIGARPISKKTAFRFCLGSSVSIVQ